MTENVKTKIYEEGNYGFMIAPLNLDNTYGEISKISGLVSIDCTMSRTITNTAADDESDYLTRVSPETGEGTITFIGLPKEELVKLYDAVTDDNNVFVSGRKGMLKKVGISFFNTEKAKYSSNSDVSSINKITFHNVIISPPNVSTTTVAEDDTTIREFALSFTANPFHFTTSSGIRDRCTWSLINSDRDSGIWDKVKDIMYIPNGDYTGTSIDEDTLED